MLPNQKWLLFYNIVLSFEKCYAQLYTNTAGMVNTYNIEEFMQEIVRQHQPNITYEKLTRTADYRDVLMLKLSHEKKSDSDGEENKPKKLIFIVHGLNVYGANQINKLSYVQGFIAALENYLKYLDFFDIYLIPFANPDGLAVAQVNPRWLKNVSPQTECSGVALDRNFLVGWDHNKVKSSCSHLYGGLQPFSELETQAVRKVLQSNDEKIVAFINIHAATSIEGIYKGDVILYPQGYSSRTLENNDHYERLKNEVQTKLGIVMTTLNDWYGKIGGTSVDYASKICNVKYSLELAVQPQPGLPNWNHIIETVFKHIHKH